MMMKKEDIKVGMPIVAVKYRPRQGEKEVIWDYIVTRIGRKYFYACQRDNFDDVKTLKCDKSWEEAIDFERWEDKNDSSPLYKFYPSRQALNEAKEAKNLLLQIREKLRYCDNLPLEDLRKIADIIGVEA